jgi:acetyl esterase/lipase
MEEIQKSREAYSQKVLPYDFAPKVTTMRESIAGVDCYWLEPDHPSPDSIVVYLHGGGFTMGSFGTHGKLASHLAAALRTRVLFIEYALAPEHPFPAGLNDVLAVYRELKARHPRYSICVEGDSAGGGLAISAVALMIDQALPLPDAVILLSPWIDLAGGNPSYEQNADRDLFVTKEMIQLFAGAYTGNMPLTVSNPRTTHLNQFPPVLMMVGSEEILLDDSKDFYIRIMKVQADSRLSVYDGQQHVWLKKNVHSDASRRAFVEMAAFMDSVASGVDSKHKRLPVGQY